MRADWSLPDIPNPFGWLGNKLGGAAASAVGDVIDGACLKLWQFSAWLLQGAFHAIATYGSPNVDPRSGPLAGVMPTTLWLGATALVVLSFVQLGRAVVSGGRGFVTLAMGFGQNLLIQAGMLTVLA